jgi:hypothetical protein
VTAVVSTFRSASLLLALTAARARVFLGPAAGDVVDYIMGQQLDSGAFPGRSGQPDIYYTQFALQSLAALEAPLPGHGGFIPDMLSRISALDLVHSVSLAISATMTQQLTPERAEELNRHIMGFQAEDGAWATQAGAKRGNPYGSFLALQAMELLGRPFPCQYDFRGLECRNGGFVNQPGSPAESATATSTAAAVACIWAAGQDPPKKTAAWLKSLFAPKIGGFRISPDIAIPDLLSTAVALFALDLQNEELGLFREPTIQFVEALWDDSGGFCGHPGDNQPDIEYTWYALLSLGCLA